MSNDSIQMLKEVLGEGVTPKPVVTTPVDHWSLAELMERGKHLREKAEKGDGSAGEVLAKYPQHFTILTFRNCTGESEIHEHHADMFYIVDGATTLVTGGNIVGARETGPGETRGEGLEGGESRVLRVGDVAHVPAGVPHHMLVAAGDTVTYFVMKNQEQA